MKRYTIRQSLFITHSVVIVVAFFIIAMMYVGTELPRQRNDVFSSLEQSGRTITYAMDSELEQMHTLASSITYSTLKHGRLRNNDLKSLWDLLATLTLPNFPVEQVFLYTERGDKIASGLVNGIFRNAIDNPNRIAFDRQRNRNNVVMYYGLHDGLSRYTTNIYGKRFTSLNLNIFDSLNRPQGNVVVMKSLSRVFQSAISYNSVYGEHIYVFDEFGTLIFPYGYEQSDCLFSYAQELDFPTTITPITLHEERAYFVTSHSSRSNFYTFVVINERALLVPLFHLATRILFVSVLSLPIVLLFVFFVAKRLTKPIDEICKEVTQFELSQPSTHTSLNLTTDIVELRTLYEHYNDMKHKLIESSNAQYIKVQEIQSRMISLQAQMSPHFLYNNLSVIQSMADEGMNEEIINMCQSMASILRYISSDSDLMVPLVREVLYTKHYLRWMETRHQGDLTYTIDIPQEMNDIKVPKLCIQMLVENAIKYSSSKRPPYHIDISGSMDATSFRISVRDNGPGFSVDSLCIIQNKIEEIETTGLMPSLEIEGMGLLNVYLRLKLLYTGKPIFKLQNIENGACITIGEVYSS